MSARPGQTVEGITVPRGDPEALQAAGKQLEGVAGQLQASSSNLSGLPSLITGWAGPGSSAFADITGQQAASVQSASLSVTMAALSVESSADALADAQRRAERAIARARKARAEIDAAKEDIRQAQADQASASLRMTMAAAEISLLSASPDAGAALQAADAAYRDAQSDLHAAQERERRARRRLHEAEDDLREARKDGQDAADDAELVGVGLQMTLASVPSAAFAMPGAPAKEAIGAAGNVPKPQPPDPGDVPIGEREPPESWPGFAKSLFKIGRGEASVIAGTASLAKKAYDNPEKIPGGLAALGSHAYHDPIGTGKALVGYDDLANGRFEDWFGAMGLGALSGGLGTMPARGSRLARVVGSPNIERLGRTPFPINSRKFAGTRMDFTRPDFGARPGTGRPNIPESRRAELAAKYPQGVRFTRAGYPVFTNEAIERVHVHGLTGERAHDAALANQAAHRTETPPGYVWHHVEDGKTMELVPRDLHDAARHTGGATAIENQQIGAVAPGGVFTPFERAGAVGGAAGAFGVAGPPVTEGR